jgi:hypothetical protein
MEGQANRSGWLAGLGMALSGVIGGVAGYFVGKMNTAKGECACKLPEKTGTNGNGTNGNGKKA